MVARPEEPEEAGQRVERKDCPAADLAPDLGQLLRRVAGVVGRDAMNAPLSAPTEVPTIEVRARSQRS